MRSLANTASSVGIAAVLGCPRAESTTIDPCARFGDQPAVHDLCLAQEVERVGKAEDVTTFCAQSMVTPATCRHAWVATHMEGKQHLGVHPLLDVCGSDPDCAMEVIDTIPDADVRVQMERCHSYALRFERDCDGHAMQRWYASSPAADEVQRLATSPTGVTEVVGRWLAARVVCDGIGTCDPRSNMGAECAKQGTIFATQPAQCALIHRPMPTEVVGNPTMPPDGRPQETPSP